jgi:hypothetical protein
MFVRHGFSLTPDSRPGHLVSLLIYIVYMRTWSRDSSVGIATGYGLDDWGEWEFESR